MCAGKKMVLRVRKRPGTEAEDVLAPPRPAGGAGGSVWGKLLGGGSKAATQDGVRPAAASTARLALPHRARRICLSSCSSHVQHSAHEVGDRTWCASTCFPSVWRGTRVGLPNMLLCRNYRKQVGVFANLAWPTAGKHQGGWRCEQSGALAC